MLSRMGSRAALIAVSSLAGAIILAAGATYAWTGPTATPPSGNTAAPINTSGTAQTKTGNLTVNGQVISTSQFRLVRGDYGSIFYNNGTDTYLLLTNSGNEYGSWNALRPFIVNNNTGSVSVNTSLWTGTLCLNGVCRTSWPTDSSPSQWTTSGTSIYYNGGKVGIGTTAPDNSLTIAGSLGGQGIHVDSSSGAGINIDRGATSNYNQLVFSTAGVNKWAIGNRARGNENLDFYIGGSATPSVTFDTSGDVGIGTASPRATLELNGKLLNTTAYNANANLSYYDIGAGTIGAGTSLYSYGSICTANSNGDCSGTTGVVIGKANTSATVNIPNSGTTFFNGGNVGVGTTAPGAKLDVSGPVNGNQMVIGPNSSRRYYFQTAANGSYNDAWLEEVSDSTVGGYAWFNSSKSKELMQVDYSGNLYAADSVSGWGIYDRSISLYMSQLRLSQQLGGTVAYQASVGSAYVCPSGVMVGESAPQGGNPGTVYYVYCRQILY